MEKRRIVGVIRNDGGNTRKVKEVIQYVKDSGGIDYAVGRMNQFHEDALAILRGFPESVYKKSLIELVQFTIDRTN